jgi:hypothetical protein
VREKGFARAQGGVLCQEVKDFLVVCGIDGGFWTFFGLDVGAFCGWMLRLLGEVEMALKVMGIVNKDLKVVWGKGIDDGI